MACTDGMEEGVTGSRVPVNFCLKAQDRGIMLSPYARIILEAQARGPEKHKNYHDGSFKYVSEMIKENREKKCVSFDKMGQNGSLLWSLTDCKKYCYFKCTEHMK